MKEHLRLVDMVRQGRCFLFRQKAVEIFRLLSICSGSMMPSNVYTPILFRVLFSHIVLFCITDIQKQLHDIRLSQKRKNKNTLCWCVYYSSFQRVRQVALNYYLSQCWKQVRQCWQTYPGVIILILKVQVLFDFSSVILFKDKQLK